MSISCILLMVQFLHAQETIKVQRKGLIFGTSLGVAYTNLVFPNKTEQATNLGLDIKIGFMLNPKTSILLSSNVSIYDYSGFGRDRKRDFGVLSPSVQYWLNNKLWLLGGVGLGGDNPVFWDIKNPEDDPLETKYFSGVGLISSIGYELFQVNEHLVIDLKARLMYRKVELQEGKTSGLSYGLLVGINFY